MGESITGRSNVVPYQNLLDLGSIPGVSVTYLTFKANKNICFDILFLYLNALIITFCLKVSQRLL